MLTDLQERNTTNVVYFYHYWYILLLNRSIKKISKYHCTMSTLQSFIPKYIAQNTTDLEKLNRTCAFL